jgi:hypothetical protein
MEIKRDDLLMESIKLLIPMTLIVILFASQYTAMLILSVPLLFVFFIKGFIRLQFRSDVMALICLMLFLSILGMFDTDHGMTSIFYVCSTIVCVVAAKYTCDKYSLIEIHHSLRMLFWLFVIVICFILFKYWEATEPFNEVLPHSSTNGIPAYLILVHITYSIVSYFLYRKVSILASLIVFGVAFFGNGRGSLVVSMGVILFSVFANMLSDSLPKSSARRLFNWFSKVIVTACLVLGGFTVFSDGLITQWDNLLKYTKLSVGLVDANRIEIFQEYIKSLSLMGYFLGGSYSGTVIDTLYAGNPHISFIRSHYLFGLIPMLFYFLSPLLILFFIKDTKVMWVIFGFVMLVWARVTTEPLLFPTILDFYYFLIFFISYKYGATKNIY